MNVVLLCLLFTKIISLVTNLIQLAVPNADFVVEFWRQIEGSSHLKTDMVTIVKLLSVAALLLLLETLMTCTAVSRNSSVPLALRRNLRSRSSRTGSSSDRSSSGSNNNRKSSSARTGSKRASNKKQLFHYSDIPQCRLSYLGEMYKDDKFIMHTFGTLYCEMLRDFRKTRGRKLRMLEIGKSNHCLTARTLCVSYRSHTSPSSPPIPVNSLALLLQVSDVDIQTKREESRGESVPDYGNSFSRRALALESNCTRWSTAPTRPQNSA